MFRKPSSAEGIHNIHSKPLVQNYMIQGQEVQFVLEEAQFATAGEGESEETIMLDEVLVQQMIADIAASIHKSASKYNPPPVKIVLHHTNEAAAALPEQESEANHSIDDDDLLNVKQPKWSFEDVYVDDSSRKHIESALVMVRHRNKMFDEWGLAETLKTSRSLSLNFYGPPGTGKSMMAEAVAHVLGKQLLVVQYAELESKYVGETPKNIMKAFQLAKDRDAVLVFDEADSILGKRLTNISQSSDYGVNITRSVMLMEMDKFDGIIIFTTNLLENYDDAFRRRILANVGFSHPDQAGRAKIWSTHLPVRMPRDSEVTAELLAETYPELTGADIKDMILYASAVCLEQNEDVVRKDHFDKAYHYVKQRYNEQAGNLTVTTQVITKEQFQQEMSESS